MNIRLFFLILITISSSALFAEIENPYQKKHFKSENKSMIAFDNSYFDSIECKRYDFNTKLKRQAFQIMDELEGWCTYQKASILIDFVLMARPQIIVEIGVFGGKSFVPMALALREIGAGVAYGIDPWSSGESVQGMEGPNKEYWSNVDHDAILRGLQEKIKKHGLENQIQLIRSTSIDAPSIFNIDILHIDGNHSDETSFIDVTKWVPLVRRGGVNYL